MRLLLRVRELALVGGAVASGTPAPAADGNPALVDPPLAELRDRYRRTAPPPVASASAWTAERHRLGETRFFDPMTPTLRDVDRRAPYMHDDSVATVADVVDLYTHARQPRASLSPDARPVALTAGETDDLPAFLRTLTGDDTPWTAPALPQ